MSVMISPQACITTEKKNFFLDGFAMMHVAALNGQAACLNYLLKLGAHVDQLDTAGHTALFLAAHDGHTECVNLLIANGANVEVVDRSTFFFVLFPFFKEMSDTRRANRASHAPHRCRVHGSRWSRARAARSRCQDQRALGVYADFVKHD